MPAVSLMLQAYKPPGIFFQDSLYLGSGEGEAVDVVGFGFRAGQRVVGAQADFVCLLLADDDGVESVEETYRRVGGPVVSMMTFSLPISSLSTSSSM